MVRNEEDDLVNAIQSLSVSEPLYSDPEDQSDDDPTVVNDDRDDEDSQTTGSLLSMDDASQIRSDFTTDSGVFSIYTSSSLSLQDQKLLLWQSILIGFQICAPIGQPLTVIRRSRTKHLPPNLFSLPESLNKCKTLLKLYVHVNLVDYHHLDTRARVFPRFAIFASFTAYTF